MSKQFFKTLESSALHSHYALDVFLDELTYDADGLIPAIAQQYDSKEVLMMAWMNRASIAESLQTGRVCYWSRSRQNYWRKGEQSGQMQILKSLSADCDGDALLLMVDQTGPACHTGRRSCFYHLAQPQSEQVEIATTPLIDPKELYK
jgi:phosphoribosyl-AMP cyclohydrolase